MWYTCVLFSFYVWSFFFKQKTAYEMRISDWSSDVCSSDLRTTVSIDGLYSNFKEDRDEHWGEVLLRSEEDNIDISNYVIDGNNSIVSADLDNVYVRTERYHRESETKFYQLSGTIEHAFSDAFRAKLRCGFSRADADIPAETRPMFYGRDPA